MKNPKDKSTQSFADSSAAKPPLAEAESPAFSLFIAAGTLPVAGRPGHSGADAKPDSSDTNPSAIAAAAGGAFPPPPAEDSAGRGETTAASMPVGPAVNTDFSALIGITLHFMPPSVQNSEEDLPQQPVSARSYVQKSGGKSVTFWRV